MIDHPPIIEEEAMDAFYYAAMKNETKCNAMHAHACSCCLFPTTFNMAQNH